MKVDVKTQRQGQPEQYYSYKATSIKYTGDTLFIVLKERPLDMEEQIAWVLKPISPTKLCELIVTEES